VVFEAAVKVVENSLFSLIKKSASIHSTNMKGKKKKKTFSARISWFQKAGNV